jgi:hypothetical protein
MAGPKQQKKKSKKPAAPARSRKKPVGASLRKRAARDVSRGPSSDRIERSLDQGTKQTLEFFRGTINWR